MSECSEFVLKESLDLVVIFFVIIGCLSLIIIPLLYTEKEEYKIKLIKHGIATYTVDIHGITKFVYLDDKKETKNDGNK